MKLTVEAPGPFIHAAVNWGIESEGVPELTPSVSIGDLRVSIHGVFIPEAEEFDTRKRTVRYILFNETPDPIWNQPADGNRSFTLPERLSGDWSEEGSSIVRYAEYTGPFTVAWSDEFGSIGKFEVK